MRQISLNSAIPWRVRIWIRERKTQKSLQAIANSSHPRAQNLYRAIDKTIAKRYSEEELAVIGQIEELRQVCLKSNEKFEFIDHGAGDPLNPVSLEESRRGKKKTTNISDLAAHTCKNDPWAQLLFNLIRELKPHFCLELGTCIGFSAAYQCGAMMLNDKGLLATLEGAKSFAEKAMENLQQIGVNNYDIIQGLFEDTLESTLERYSPFDFMFNDGHHDGQAMLSYFEKCLPSFSNDAVLLFDDIATYPSMRAAWKSLWTHERIGLVIDFGPMGLVGLREGKGEPAQVFQVPI